MNFFSALLFVSLIEFLAFQYPLCGQENEAKKPSTLIESQSLLVIIDAQLSAIRKGQIEEAYQQYTSTAFRNSTTLDQFADFINKHEAIAKNKSFQHQSYYVEDGMASFHGTLTSSSGQELQVEIDLIQEDGKWVIYGFQIFKPVTSSQTPVKPPIATRQDK